ncbi:expressed unknown protein [Seminavis robusta]|uniref:Uncharacterized protein n=1 Tax=Seminavis robusta TaxID=568900 RepID=A0A9N8EAC7_9STRA|nr:expressed unknown protein [Seminavis robusta]|eukprot:Sro836_g209020.1 n/a (284) ;mRNA; f:28388-29335
MSSEESFYVGKWTDEEADYVAGLIDNFEAGTLNDVPDGTTLRGYLAKMAAKRAKKLEDLRVTFLKSRKAILKASSGASFAKMIKKTADEATSKNARGCAVAAARNQRLGQNATGPASNRTIVGQGRTINSILLSANPLNPSVVLDVQSGPSVHSNVLAPRTQLLIVEIPSASSSSGGLLGASLARSTHGLQQLRDSSFSRLSSASTTTLSAPAATSAPTSFSVSNGLTPLGVQLAEFLQRKQQEAAAEQNRKQEAIRSLLSAVAAAACNGSSATRRNQLQRSI